MTIFVCASTWAQVNSWTPATGGNWDDAASWSLGVPPGSGQSIVFTNAFWKAITIDSSTVAGAPQSLAVNSLTITSTWPPNGVYTTRNTLLLNYAGAGNPLVIGVDANTPGSVLVDSNSIMAMFSSGLIVNDALDETNARLGEFQVDGNFIQSDNSEVVAGFLDLNGTYNMTNGQLFVVKQFINGTFNQQGGTNIGSIVAGTNGDYELFDGAFNGDMTLSPGHFTQWGGTVSATFTFGQPAQAGVYNLMGGNLFPGDVILGATPITNYDVFPSGVIEQSGGTNNPTSFTMALGVYYLTNGVFSTPVMTLTTNTWIGNFDAGDFEQYGGYATNGALTMIGGTNDYREQIFRVAAKYNLYRGIVETPSLTMKTADFGIGGHGVDATNRVGTLSMDASIYALGAGGLLVADQIQLSNGSELWCMGGTVAGDLNVTMANGILGSPPNGTQFGQLQLLSGTNSSLYLGNSSVIQFANSGGVSWASDGVLTIQGWTGSLSGGGADQIFFGASASGLTAQQLGQVQFYNPEGLPDGTYSAQILSDGEVVPNAASSSSGPINSWINSTSGNWDQSANWSLGVLPEGSQTVLIANTNWKAIAINPSTPVDFPGSMTISNLFINGATNTENTLLLNNFGTVVPLTVLNGITLRDGAQILNFNSGLSVQSGLITVTNSQINQDGGFFYATNAMILQNSVYNLTNGLFNIGKVFVGNPTASRFNQYGGSVTIGILGFWSYGGTNVNGYSLYGGMLNLPNGMGLYGEKAGLSYFQSGGTNQTTDIVIEPDYGGSTPSFTLNGGLLADSNVRLISGDIGGAQVLTQNGGSHVITNSLSLEGADHLGEYEIPAIYNLSGGTLSAGTIELNANEGDAQFLQTNATVFAGTVYAHSLGYFSQNNTTITLAGGSLNCSNFDLDDGGGNFNQSGGALVVTNLLSVSGYRYLGLIYSLYGSYTFTGGTVTASNINISGKWIIGDGSTNRISNPGILTLSHLLQINNAVEQLGRFILAGTNAAIDLAGAASRLSFTNSSGEAWTSGAILTVADWNGDPAGGGAEQLKFGSDSSGLTPAQLNQIQFSVGTNLYPAKILNTGEVVPYQAAKASVAFVQQGKNLVLSWPAGYFLQTATNAWGPYADVPSATTPYTNDTTLDPQRFFRLRQ